MQWCSWFQYCTTTPMESLGFFIALILPAALWPCGWLILENKWVPGVFPGGKGGCCICLMAWKFWQPQLPWALRPCIGIAFFIIKMFSSDEVTEFLFFFLFLQQVYITLYHVYVNVYNSVYSVCGLQGFDSDFIVNFGPKPLTLVTDAAFFNGSTQL
jgi:hypothetical protein